MIKADKPLPQKGRPCKLDNIPPPSVQKLDKLAQMRYVLLDTIKEAMKKGHRGITAPQYHGFQYISHAYFRLTQSYGFSPSMSKRGNPYDNALVENFFFILKQNYSKISPLMFIMSFWLH